MGNTPEAPQAGGTASVDLGLDKVRANTQGDLGKLKIELGNEDSIIASLIDNALKGFDLDLDELVNAGKIKVDQKAGIIEEYKKNVGVKIDALKPNGIDSPEATELESFITDINNFPILKKAVDANQPIPGLGPIATEVEKMLASVTDLPGFETSMGTLEMRAKIYDALKWLAEKLKIDTSNWVKKKPAEVSSTPEKKPENFEKMDASSLFASASEQGEKGQPAKDYLAKLFPKDKFGELKPVEPGKITFVDPNSKKESTYTLEKNAISGFSVKKVGQRGNGESIDGSQAQFIAALDKLNTPDNRVN